MIDIMTACFIIPVKHSAMVIIQDICMDYITQNFEKIHIPAKITT